MPTSWTWMRYAQRERRAHRLPIRRQRLLDLNRQGYDVHELTPAHLRVNGLVDCFPVHNTWHDLRTGERGGAPDLVAWVRQHVGAWERREY